MSLKKNPKIDKGIAVRLTRICPVMGTNLTESKISSFEVNLSKGAAWDRLERISPCYCLGV